MPMPLRAAFQGSAHTQQHGGQLRAMVLQSHGGVQAHNGIAGQLQERGGGAQLDLLAERGYHGLNV